MMLVESIRCVRVGIPIPTLQELGGGIVVVVVVEE